MPQQIISTAPTARRKPTTTNAVAVATSTNSYCSSGNSTAYLQWRITWTQAFPTVVHTLLHDENGNDEDDDDDDLHDVWNCLAFRCLWNDDDEKIKGQDKSRKTHKGLRIVDNDHRWIDSLGYGEITEWAVWEILQLIRQQQSTGCCSRCARIKQPGVTKSVGLEIVPALHRRAVRLASRWNEMNPILNDDKTANTALDLRCSDFTADTEWIETADIVFMHCTVFSKALFTTMCELCAKVKPGTWLVTVSHPMRMLDVFECVSEHQVEMSWGRGLVYLQRKR
jgi:hypothetical protein